MSDVEEIKSDHQPTPNGMVRASYAQYLERELNAANERIKRLEEAGDVLAQRAEQLGLLPMAIEGWNKAKEAKP